MAVQPGRRYEAVVLATLFMQSKGKGTPCIYFKFRTEDGRIEHELYISDKTDSRVAETMKECFGIERKKLGELLTGGTIGSAVFGKELSITTESKPYEDRHGNKQEKVVVKWMNPLTLPVDPAGARAIELVGRLFGSVPARQETRTGSRFGGIDDDIPPDEEVPY